MQRKKQLNLIFCDRQESPTKRKEVGFAVHNCQMISIFVGPRLGENQYRPRLLFPVSPSPLLFYIQQIPTANIILSRH